MVVLGIGFLSMVCMVKEVLEPEDSKHPSHCMHFAVLDNYIVGVGNCNFAVLAGTAAVVGHSAPDRSNTAAAFVVVALRPHLLHRPSEFQASSASRHLPETSRSDPPATEDQWVEGSGVELSDRFAGELLSVCLVAAVFPYWVALRPELRRHHSWCKKHLYQSGCMRIRSR